MRAHGILRGLLPAAGLAAFLSCSAGPPPRDIAEARIALQDAKNAGADQLAPREYDAAVAHFHEAQSTWDSRKDADASAHWARLAWADARRAQYVARSRRRAGHRHARDRTPPAGGARRSGSRDRQAPGQHRHGRAGFSGRREVPGQCPAADLRRRERRGLLVRRRQADHLPVQREGPALRPDLHHERRRLGQAHGLQREGEDDLLLLLPRRQAHPLRLDLPRRRRLPAGPDYSRGYVWALRRLRDLHGERRRDATSARSSTSRPTTPRPRSRPTGRRSSSRRSATATSTSTR